nr:reverse transcriptase domain-containing protein [Tanacetum cinerariifolium]
RETDGLPTANSNKKPLYRGKLCQPPIRRARTIDLHKWPSTFDVPFDHAFPSDLSFLKPDYSFPSSTDPGRRCSKWWSDSSGRSRSWFHFSFFIGPLVGTPRPTAKGVGLRVADSRTGNHPEVDFMPLETIRRLCSVFGRRSHLGFEWETSEPKGRVRHQNFIPICSAIRRLAIKASYSASLTALMASFATARVLKNGNDFSADLDRNLFRLANFPFRFCTSFKHFGDGKLMTASTLSGHTFNPSTFTLYPRNVPSFIPKRVSKQRITQTFSSKSIISFPPLGEEDGTECSMIIVAQMGGHFVHRMYMDRGSSSEILYEHFFNRFRLEVRSQMVPATTPLIGFSREKIWPLGKISLLVKIGNEEHSTSAWINFMVVRSPSPYNGKSPGVRKIQAMPSTAHGMLKFPVAGGMPAVIMDLFHDAGVHQLFHFFVDCFICLRNSVISASFQENISRLHLSRPHSSFRPSSVRVEPIAIVCFGYGLW